MPQFSDKKWWSIAKGILIVVSRDTIAVIKVLLILEWGSSDTIAMIEVLLIIEYAWGLIGKGGI